MEQGQYEEVIEIGWASGEDKMIMDAGPLRRAMKRHAAKGSRLPRRAWRDRHRYDDCFGNKLRAGAASPDGQGDGSGGHYALRHMRDVTSGRNAHGSGGR